MHAERRVRRTLARRLLIGAQHLRRALHRGHRRRLRLPPVAVRPDRQDRPRATRSRACGDGRAGRADERAARRVRHPRERRRAAEDAQVRRRERTVGGQRSDTIMVLHVDPQAEKAAILSIPRDLCVTIAGTGAATASTPRSSRRRRRAADRDDHAGASASRSTTTPRSTSSASASSSNAVGGVTIYVPGAGPRHASPGSTSRAPGASTLDGDQALAYVRSRHYQYFESGRWRTDPTGDLGASAPAGLHPPHDDAGRSRRASATRSSSTASSAAAIKNVTIDDGAVDQGHRRLGKRFRSLEPDAVDMLTLPVDRRRAIGGAVGAAAQAARGPGRSSTGSTARRRPRATPSRAARTIPPSTVRVRVLNGSGAGGPGRQGRAAALQRLGLQRRRHRATPTRSTYTTPVDPLRPRPAGQGAGCCRRYVDGGAAARGGPHAARRSTSCSSPAPTSAASAPRRHGAPPATTTTTAAADRHRGAGARRPAGAPSPSRSTAELERDEGADPRRRRGHPAAADHPHQRQAAGAGGQQADPVLRARGHGRGRHRRGRHRRRRHRATRSWPRSATGQRWGVEVTYIPQDAPLGLAHCVLIARDFLGDDDFVMYLGDNLLEQGVADVRRRVRSRRGDAVGPDPAAPRCPTRSASAWPSSTPTARSCAWSRSRPTRRRTSPSSASTCSTAAIHEAVRAIEPSARGELEITDAIQWLIDQGHRVQHAGARRAGGSTPAS